MKYYILGIITIAFVVGGCQKQASNISGKINNVIQKISYETQQLSSPVFIFTGTVFSGTQSIKITYINSGINKEYTIPYNVGEKVFQEEFRLDKGNITYGINTYTLNFFDKDNVLLAKGILNLKTYYQEIQIGGYTIYFDEKTVRNCGENCWINDSYETSKMIEYKNNDVIGSGERYSVESFLNEDIMPYSDNGILYKSGNIFLITTGYILYNRNLGQFFQAENIYSMTGNDRLQLGELYLNSKLMIKNFPIKYRNTGGGSMIPIVYQPEKDLISVKWHDGDGCGYTKGEAIYNISNGKLFKYNEINPQGLTLQIDNKKLEIIQSVETADEELLSLESRYSVFDKAWIIKKEELLIDKKKLQYTNSESMCEQKVKREINEKKQEIIVNQLPIVGGISKTFIRKFDNNGNIKRIK